VKSEKLKVLLVDDEKEFITALAERLQIRGIEAHIETDSLQALAKADELVPDVVVLDILMPGINGLDILRQLKDKHPGIKVILLTGRGSTQEGMEGMRLGAFDFLMKPIKIEVLMASLKDALKGDAS
jgi:DNA-binding NtrC family response regulator